jgi:hypothetical protein
MKVEEEENVLTMVCSVLFFSQIWHQGCRGMCLTRFAHLDLKFPIFFFAICMLQFFIAICILRRAMCILRCNIDYFLLIEVVLGTKSMLPKNSCNMHIERRNMHVAIEFILPPTHTWVQ